MTPGQIATVTVQVDFPDAEGIWVARWDLHNNDSIIETIDRCRDSIIDTLVKDAGRLYAARVKYGKGLIR